MPVVESSRAREARQGRVDEPALNLPKRPTPFAGPRGGGASFDKGGRAPSA